MEKIYTEYSAPECRVIEIRSESSLLVASDENRTQSFRQDDDYGEW